MAKPKYTLEQVKKHKKANDIWIVVRDKVYDITQFLEEHPGGDTILIDNAGTDSTEAFDDVGHSEEAEKDLEDYYIADITTDPSEADEAPEPKGSSSAVDDDSDDEAPSPQPNTQIYKTLAFPLIALAIGYFVKMYMSG